MFYEEAGSGPEPLVLVHGYTSSRRNWVETIPRLPLDRFHVYAFDLRGAGQTDKPASGHSPAQYADDVAAAMTSLGVDSFHYVGHSMGGATGMELALRHPQRLRKLVLVAPAPSGGVPLDPQMTALMQAARQDKERYKAFFQMNIVRPLDGRLIDIMVDDAFSVSDAHVLESSETMRDLRISERLQEISAPTLMVVGDRDFLRTFNLEDAARIPNCALHVFYRVGHMIPWDVPQEFADLLVDFLENGSAPPLDFEILQKQMEAILAPA
jgi:pimeloyl-ACP methyl ester carboxylesterase